jgi:predicted LPLAT superfamily acyltransferase
MIQLLDILLTALLIFAKIAAFLIIPLVVAFIVYFWKEERQADRDYKARLAANEEEQRRINHAHDILAAGGDFEASFEDRNVLTYRGRRISAYEGAHRKTDPYALIDFHADREIFTNTKDL